MREQIRSYLEHARWFGGKGRPFEVSGVRRLPMVSTNDRTVTIELVELTYADGGSDVYQLPLSYYAEPQPALQHALVGTWDDDLGHVYAYDALHDHEATPTWLAGFRAGGPLGAVTFHQVGDEVPVEADARSTLLTGEQSNSSVAYGETGLMKLFRRVTPGQNPDIEILTALTQQHNEHVAALYGWVEAQTEKGETLQLGFLQQFLRTASDGWDLALASLRTLYAGTEEHADQSGGDFAAEAERLGVSVAEIHQMLAEAFPTESWQREELYALADSMSARLEAALDVVPDLAPLAAGLHARFDAVRHLQHPVPAQRVHGDLHLGQTLRTVRNWKVIDFEGEPAKALEERRRPDSPWRDVAGMLRSFDYAAEITRIDHEQAAGDADEVAEERAREWSSRNVEAFLTGYSSVTGTAPERSLLVAYATDKAVYEAVYEARNRPAWLPIPMAALRRAATSGGEFA